MDKNDWLPLVIAGGLILLLISRKKATDYVIQTSTGTVVLTPPPTTLDPRKSGFYNSEIDKIFLPQIGNQGAGMGILDTTRDPAIDVGSLVMLRPDVTREMFNGASWLSGRIGKVVSMSNPAGSWYITVYYSDPNQSSGNEKVPLTALVRIG